MWQKEKCLLSQIVNYNLISGKTLETQKKKLTLVYDAITLILLKNNTRKCFSNKNKNINFS